MAAILRDIHEELQRTRAEAAESNRRLTDALSTEMRLNRRLLRLLAQQRGQSLESEIAATFDAIKYSFAETLDILHRERLSLTRFGDGELMLMADPDQNLQFQRNSAGLRRELVEALNPRGAAQGRVLVALPHLFRGNPHWSGVWLATWDMLKSLLDPEVRYGDAHVSRPIFFQGEGAAGIARWRRLWDGREVLIVTGRESRFDLVPDLFDGVSRVEILHTVSTDAYEHREAILRAILDRAKADTLVLLSLGPAATVLVPRIAAAGVQALDIGHISASYLNIHARGAMPEAMPVIRDVAMRDI